MQQRDQGKATFHVVFLTSSAVRHKGMWQQSACTMFTVAFQLKHLAGKSVCGCRRWWGVDSRSCSCNLGRTSYRFSAVYESCFCKVNLIVKNICRKVLCVSLKSVLIHIKQTVIMVTYSLISMHAHTQNKGRRLSALLFLWIASELGFKFILKRIALSHLRHHG